MEFDSTIMLLLPCYMLNKLGQVWYKPTQNVNSGSKWLKSKNFSISKTSLHFKILKMKYNLQTVSEVVQDSTLDNQGFA